MNLNVKNLSIYSIFRDLFFNAWVIVLAVLTAYLGSYVYVNNFHEDVYTASMTVSVNERNTTSYSVSTAAVATETANIFQTLFQSEVMRDKIEDITGKPMDGVVTAKIIQSTNIMTISAQASSPLGAFTTLKAVFDNYRLLTDYKFDNVVMYVLSYPTVPSGPSNRISVMSVAKKYMVLAFAVSAALIAAISFLRDTVKSEAAVKSSLMLDIFGTIYHERKNKTLKSYFANKNKRLMLTDTLVNGSYINAFNKIAMKLDYLHNSRGKKVIMISSTDENEGKTTVAVNTAIALANRGGRVLLVDLDMRKPSIWRFFTDIDFGSDEKQIAQVIKNRSMKPLCITRDTVSGVYVLAGKKSVTHSSEYLSSWYFPALIEKLRECFDYIIIDTSPYALISDAEIIAGSCDGILLVVRQDATVTDAINETISALSKKTGILGCVFNDVKTIRGLIPDFIRDKLPGNMSEYY